MTQTATRSIEVFRPGTFIALDGQEHEFSADDVRARFIPAWAGNTRWLSAGGQQISSGVSWPTRSDIPIPRAAIANLTIARRHSMTS